jgi:hypothetical protein
VQCATIYAEKLKEAHDSGVQYENAAKAFKNVNTKEALRCYNQAVDILVSSHDDGQTNARARAVCNEFCCQAWRQIDARDGRPVVLERTETGSIMAHPPSSRADSLFVDRSVMITVAPISLWAPSPSLLSLSLSDGEQQVRHGGEDLEGDGHAAREGAQRDGSHVVLPEGSGLVRARDTRMMEGCRCWGADGMTRRLFFAPLILNLAAVTVLVNLCARYFAATRPTTLLREFQLHAAFASIASMLICADDARVTCRVVFGTRR